MLFVVLIYCLYKSITIQRKRECVFPHGMHRGNFGIVATHLTQSYAPLDLCFVLYSFTLGRMDKEPPLMFYCRGCKTMLNERCFYDPHTGNLNSICTMCSLLHSSE